MNTKLTIQEKLKDLRVERHLTLEQLAEETGISPGVFSSLARSWSSQCFPGGHIPFGRSFSCQGSPVASNTGKSVRILQQKKSLSRISKRMEKTLDFSNFHGYRQP